MAALITYAPRGSFWWWIDAGVNSVHNADHFTGARDTHFVAAGGIGLRWRATAGRSDG